MKFENEKILIPAIKDYYYLINNSYPEKGSLKLVGDRYKLNSENRTMLYRGICPKSRAIERGNRLIDSISGESIVVDGYNVLFTILNYRMGRFLFIACDGILRDAGSLFGKIRKEEVFLQAINFFLNYLIKHQPQNVTVYLDSPVSHSKKHIELINNEANTKNLKIELRLVDSADYYLKLHSSEILCTSDSGILDNTSNPVFDLAHKIIEKEFNPQFLNLKTIFKELEG